MQPQSEQSDNPNTRSETSKRVDSVMNGFVEQFAVMAKNTSERRKALEAYLIPKRRQVPCSKGGSPHSIDVEESFRASGIRGDWQLVYSPCEKCKRDLDNQWLARAGVPQRLVDSDFDNWKPRTASDMKALTVVKTFAEKGNGFLILSGQVGLGKSHLAVAVMRHRRCGRMLTQNNLIVRLRERYSNEYAENILEKCKASKLLVLDEFGFASGGKDELPALYEILDHRHGAFLPTVLTTNVQIERFDEAFGDRLADRLRCHQPFIVLKGESWRGQ